jgi:MFS family permease
MSSPSRLARLPIFYGWIIVAAAFVTMGVGVNARTAFSLLFPPILTEFAWDRGVVAGVFSFGFFVSAFLSPFVGRLMDRKGPRFVVEIGAILLAIGLALAPFSREPWQLYLTLGMLVGAGGNLLGYGVQSQFIPNWFVRRRGLAIGIAFSGVGIGSIVLLPWLQHVIAGDGWR